ncbi:MAG: hypothetical protein WBI07_05095 [Mobilitalea sp.]
MPRIRPISNLRNNANEISEFCHNELEPVFITKNGVTLPFLQNLSRTLCHFKTFD